MVTSRETAPPWWRRLAAAPLARPRFSGAVVLGLLCWILMPCAVPGPARTALAWDLGCAAFIVLILLMMGHSGEGDIRGRAAREDPSVAIDFLIATAAAGFSLYAVGSVLRGGEALGPAWIGAAIAGATIFLSWCVTHLLFT